MELDPILQNVLAYAPALVSIITMICTVIAAVKKVKSTTDKTIVEMAQMNKDNKELKEYVGVLLQENAELKDSLQVCMNRLNNVAEVDDGKKR